MTRSLIVVPVCAGLLLCGVAIAQTNGGTASNSGASQNGPYAQEHSGPNTPPTDGPGTTPKISSTGDSGPGAASATGSSHRSGGRHKRSGDASQPGTNGRSKTSSGTFNASPPSDTSYPSESNPNGNTPNAKPGTPVGPVPPGAAGRPNSVNPTNSSAARRTKAADGVPSNRGNHVLSPKKDEATGSKTAGGGGNPAGTAGGR